MCIRILNHGGGYVLIMRAETPKVTEKGLQGYTVRSYMNSYHAIYHSIEHQKSCGCNPFAKKNRHVVIELWVVKCGIRKLGYSILLSL
jgi:hypothetical protein